MQLSSCSLIMKIVLQWHFSQALLQINKNLDIIFSLNTRVTFLKAVSYTSRKLFYVHFRGFLKGSEKFALYVFLRYNGIGK